MLTPEFVTLLWIALGVNLLVFAAALVAPRIRAALERRRRARSEALRAIAGPHRPGLANAAEPWFPAVPRPPVGDDDAGGLAPSPNPRPLAEPATAGAWAAWLDEETARAARYHRSATVVLIELSGLERLTERVGPAAAERLVPPVSATIRRHARLTDRVAQLSQTRFGVLLVETDEVSAINYVERVRAACDIWLAAGAIALRLSIGWSEIRSDRSAEVAWVEAEQRLFAERRRAGHPDATTSDHDGLVAALRPAGS
jgi:diguanylate cyclase (GGDEF)-like protein